MSLARLRGETVDVRLWTPVDQVESQALTQLRNIASLPWVAHVAVMPDVHFGKGATVGSVIGMRGAVSPAAVGVDIGCGMGAVRTSLGRGGPAREPPRPPLGPRGRDPGGLRCSRRAGEAAGPAPAARR